MSENTNNNSHWEIVKVLEDIVGKKEYWVLDDRQEVKDKIKKLLEYIVKNKTHLKSKKTIYYLIKVTTYMNYEASIRILSNLDKTDKKLLIELLSVSKAKSVSEIVKEPELTEEENKKLKEESEVIMRRFKLLLSLELIGKIFDPERRERIHSILTTN